MWILKSICLKPSVGRRLTLINVDEFSYPRSSAFIRGY
jgi:hypothetical protein